MQVYEAEDGMKVMPDCITPTAPDVFSAASERKKNIGL